MSWMLRLLLSLSVTASLPILPLSSRSGSPSASRQNPPATGTIQGRVVFTGKTIPEPTVIENVTDPESCGTLHSFEDLLISKKNRGIQNVILSLANENFAWEFSPPSRKLTIDNRNCRFEPHVAVLPAGSILEAVNSDPLYHSVHLYYGTHSQNLSLHVGATVRETLHRPGLIVVKCDIHGWMKAFIRVDLHPFHDVSDADGNFAIPGIPPGSYTFEAWHEYFGKQQRKITIEPGKTLALEIEYSN